MRKIFLTSAFVVLLGASNAFATIRSYSLEWSGASFANSAVAKGIIQIDDTLLANPGTNSTDTSFVVSLTLNVSGASAGNGTFTLADYISGQLTGVTLSTGGAELDLDKELVGQATSGDPWGTSQPGNTGGNFNLFPGGGDPAAPSGTYYFELTTNGGNGVKMLLISFHPLTGDPICGDVNDSGTVSSSDALRVLKKGVGQAIDLQCAPPSLLVQTGQTRCYDGSGSGIACAGTGQDGDTLRGLAVSYTDNGDGTITDNKTGLMWEKLDDSNLDGLAGIHDRDAAYSWSAAFGKVSALNSIVFAGHTDWRLPNRKELDSIIDLGRVSLATNPVFHNSGCTAGCTVTSCSCTQPDYYWSSSTYQGSPTYAWYVDFNSGPTYANSKTNTYYVRGVRAGS